MVAADEYGGDDVARATGGVQAAARESIRTGRGDMVMGAARRIAAKMVGMAELDGIRASYEELLRRHKTVSLDYCHGCHKTVGETCPIFDLTAANLELLELLDGSRFSCDWAGPVRERRW